MTDEIKDELKKEIKDEAEEIIEDEDDIIELEDENGEIQPYRIVADVEYDGKGYVMLQPCFEGPDPDMVWMFRIEYDEKDDIELYELESEEEEKAVFNEFKLALGEEGYEFDE